MEFDLIHRQVLTRGTNMAIVDVIQPPPQGQKAILLFWAPWNDASKPGGTMDRVLSALVDAAPPSSGKNNVLFGRVQAEDCASLTDRYGVEAVPTFVMVASDGQVIEKVEGEDAARVTQAAQRLFQIVDQQTTPSDSSNADARRVSPEEELNARLDRLIRTSEVMLFMKGRPDAPRCGFSRQVVELLGDESIPFGSFDILTDEAVRQGLKVHSNWPTYPQLYVNGTLVGGLDILKEMKQEGSLREQLGLTELTSQTSKKPTLEERLKQLVRKEPIMLFMKGLPSAPRCGFSRQMVEILEGEGVPFGAFDILEDDEVRQGLKSISNWPTYPQLYVNGSLIGGLDIVKELKDDGSLKEELQIE
jgi:Grx4 family monothiol glutaredoxin